MSVFRSIRMLSAKLCGLEAGSNSHYSTNVIPEPSAPDVWPLPHLKCRPVYGEGGDGDGRLRSLKCWGVGIGISRAVIG
jgi:hypothetical protein